MKRLVKMLEWLMSHMYIRTKNQNRRIDEFDNDDVKPHPTTEIGIRLEF